MLTKIILINLILALSSLTYAKINVITTTTDIKWLTEQIGGDKVEVESLLNGTEDPHYIDAMPHFIAKVANADMFCLVGLDLEVGWAPKILSRFSSIDSMTHAASKKVILFNSSSEKLD